MAETIQKPEALNIYSLLGGQPYMVPLYQRNYAWKRQEIRQFLDDIFEKSKDGKDSIYYIGTLVVDNVKENRFEIIDGQQRFTTITVINAVLKGLNLSNALAMDYSTLEFDARDEVKNYLNTLFSAYPLAKLYDENNKEVLNFKNAVKYVEEFLYDLQRIKTDAVSQFCDYFYKNVKIIRLNVPTGTDINHYFEIMNNRGEQLEKHEILKAKFISQLPKNKPELSKRFAEIWEACSQMDRHVVSNLRSDLRKDICGENYDLVTDFYLKENDFDEVEVNELDKDEHSLQAILKLSLNPTDKNGTDAETKTSKFKSIIDFPNFLLQILKLEFNTEVSLDDKKLLDEFGYTMKCERSLPNSIQFINELLYYRLLFDRFVIKREEGNDDWSWNLSKPNRTSDNTLNFVNTFGRDDYEDDDEISYKDMVMLQAMFHVSFPGNNYKDWLQGLLLFVKENGPFIELPKFKVKLLQLAEEQLKKSTSAGWFAGLRTQRYVFNYLDYIIWLNRDNYNLSDIGKEKFRKFRFTQNNSVEHLHPQRYMQDLTALPDDPDFYSPEMILNYFGNLCLISQGSNSRYSDYNFEAKKMQFNKSSSVESLKQVLMFEYESWTSVQIKKHGEETIEMLEKCLV